MTFRVEIVFDKHYSCPSGHDSNEHATDLDRRTWTCRTCQQSVHIEMVDKAGNSYIVERRQAREIRMDDYIVYRVKSGIACNFVTGSNPSKYKVGKWYLGVKDFGSDADLSPDQYISRIP